MDLMVWWMLCATATLFGAVASDKCADECSCKWKSGKRTVECIDRALTSIPEWIDPETQVLDTSGNDIKTLPSNIFVRVRLTNLQRLYLRECRIDRIDSEALTGLTNLVELDLSNNLLTAVPSASFSDTPFLRDLVLAYNPLERVHSHAFKNTPNLVKLDLSYAQILEIESKGFRGLELLESLKLNNNRLSTLHPGTFESLNKLTSIELHDNPWVCDCHLREMKMWLVKHNLPTLVAPICHGPEQLLNRVFTDLGIDDFACRPVLLIASRYAEATIGENASIVCRVSAIPPAKVKWYWNGRLLTNHSAFSSYQKILIFEEGQFRKRSTLVLTNAQEADSSEFYCVAENRAGSVEANFTLHVSLRTAGMSTLGSGQIAGISAALVVLILFILLVILVLFIRLRRMPVKEVKSSAGSNGGSNTASNGGSSAPLDGFSADGAAPSTTAASRSGENLTSSSVIQQHQQLLLLASTGRKKLHDEIETTSFGGGVCVGSGSSALGSSNNVGASPSGDDELGVIGGCFETKPPISLNLSYVQRPQPAIVQRDVKEYGQQSTATATTTGVAAAAAAGVMPSACFSSTTSLMPIDNPDLIRDTRRGSIEDVTSYGVADYGTRIDSAVVGVGCVSGVSGVGCSDDKILYSSCLWDTRDVRDTRDTACRTSLTAVGAYPSKEALAVVAPIVEQFPPGAKQMRVWQKGVPVLPPVSALKRVLGSTRSSPDEGYQEGTGTDV